MNSYPEIALTGVGLVSPVGMAPDVFFSFLKELPSGKLEMLAGLAPGLLVSHLGITDPKLKLARYMDPVSKNAIVAMREVTANAGVSEENIAADPWGYGIVLGTTRGACVTREGLYDGLAARAWRLASGTLFSHCGYNIAGAMTAIAYGIKGPNLTLAGRDDAGLSVLRRARQLIVANRAHTVFAGFTWCDGAQRRGSAPLAECALLLCLENKDRALARGANILAEVAIDEPGTTEKGAIYGLRTCGRPAADDRVALQLPFPGMAAVGGNFSSLLMVGVLAHDREIRSSFQGSAFAAGTAAAGGMVRLVYGTDSPSQ